MSFVNREGELARLERWWERSERMALVWGRRRVGKTALIRRFSEQRTVVFHTASGEAQSAELAALSRRVAVAFPADLRDLAVSPYRDWHDALDHLARLARDQPVLFALDEFPELLVGSPALPGVLRAFWDQVQGRTRLKILLCGSAVRAMFSLQETRAPLYGRFDLVLPVHPFRPHEAVVMLGQLTPADRALVYGIVGGMPLYLSWWDQGASLAENLFELACQPGARLLSEGELVLATEAGDGEFPGQVLRAIAHGRTKYSEIADMVEINPTRPLERLMELRLVERVQPVTETTRSRRRLYRIRDNFLGFYLGPLQRYRAEIELGNGSSILPALTRRLDGYLGPRYEDAFRDHLRRLAAAGELGSDVVAVGSWWRTDGTDEIDAVVLAEPEQTRVPVLVGEAKWARSANGARIQAQLREKAVALTPDRDTLRYAVCARDEVTHADRGLMTITARDIFG